MKAVGIDPGKRGALVWLDDDGASGTLLMPLRGRGDKEVDGEALARWLLGVEPDLVVLERLGARNLFNQQGKAVRKAGNEFRLATGYGVVTGAVQAMGLPLLRPPPMLWKPAVLGRRGADKQAAIGFCADEYPGVDLNPGRLRVPHDGIADALCLAVYGLTKGRNYKTNRDR